MIPYGKQDITQQDIDAVINVLKSDFLTQGPQVPLFESTVADYCGAKFGVAVNSATSALHIACLALGVSEGDYVWTSPITFVASANCALYCGAKVDFVDIELLTGNISITALEEKLIQELEEQQLPTRQIDNSPKLMNFLENLDDDIAYAFINAGIVTPGDVTDITRGALVQDVDINLRSAMCLNHACAKKMKRQGVGHLINTVSMAAVVSLRGAAAYSASKFGLRGFLIALKSELASHGVYVSMLLPSAIDTPMLRYEAMHGGSPLNFISSPLSVDDVVRAFVKAQNNRKLEYYVPYSDSLIGRLVCFFPQMIDWLYPTLEKLGERGRRLFIESKAL